MISIRLRCQYLRSTVAGRTSFVAPVGPAFLMNHSTFSEVHGSNVFDALEDVWALHPSFSRGKGPQYDGVKGFALCEGDFFASIGLFVAPALAEHPHSGKVRFLPAADVMVSDGNRVLLPSPGRRLPVLS